MNIQCMCEKPLGHPDAFLAASEAASDVHLLEVMIVQLADARMKVRGTFLKGCMLHGSFLTWVYPQIIHFNGIFSYKPTTFGYSHCWKPHMDSSDIYLYEPKSK